MKRNKYKQGKFKPSNPEKYIGNVDNIIFRSSLEYRFMRIFDERISIVKWGSEEIHIPYFFEVDKKIHNYFPDFFIEFIDKTGKKRKALVEIKPLSFCSQPKQPGRITEAYKRRVVDYIKNKNKWDAAKIFCSEHDLDFYIFTEKDLGPTISD